MTGERNLAIVPARTVYDKKGSGQRGFFPVMVWLPGEEDHSVNPPS